MRAKQRNIYRRISAWLALAIVILAQCPMPQVVLVRVDGSVAQGQSFPCQGHSCGCASAEQCWSGCCCFSPRERLAWAKTHSITPPKSLLIAVQESDVKSAKLAHSTAKCQHCVSSKEADHSQSTSESEKYVRFIPVASAMRCRGLSTSVAMLPPAVVCECQSFSYFSTSVIDRLTADDHFAASVILSIDPPRPKDVLLG